MNRKKDILQYMSEYEIIAAGDRCSYFDAMVESLQEAGIQAEQMLIADYDRVTGYDPEVHPRGAEVYVLVPIDRLAEALELLKRRFADSSNTSPDNEG
jgi:hypothetical protein